MGYAFVALTPAEIEERRRQLDLAGFYAWLSPLVVLGGIWLYRMAAATTTTTTKSSKSRRDDTKKGTVPTKPSILNTTYVREFGPLHVQVLGLGYLAWLLYLVFRATGQDYMHLTKAFGHVAVSQLPAHYLLALRVPEQYQKWSPVTFATGLSRQQLNPYHRLFGRLLHGLVAAHAVLYLRFFVATDLLARRILDRDVRLGLAAFWTFNFLALLAIPPIRRNRRGLFYRSHVTLSALILLLVWFHVPSTRIYVGHAGVVWLVTAFTSAYSRAK